jgi:hypothetical protein
MEVIIITAITTSNIPVATILHLHIDFLPVSVRIASFSFCCPKPLLNKPISAMQFLTSLGQNLLPGRLLTHWL